MFSPRVSQFPLPGLFKFYHREGRGSTFSREKMSNAESDSEFALGNICKYQNRMNPLLTLGFASGAPTVDLYFLQFCSIIQVRLVCSMQYKFGLFVQCCYNEDFCQ